MAFDLDDEELKATRKLNGIDKDVGSMEEDINKLIEELTKARPDELSTEGLKLFNKINEIIDKNKELKENSIPVSLVEEKIEEFKNSIDLAIDNSKGGLDEEFIEKGSELLAQKKVLQELLEKRK